MDDGSLKLQRLATLTTGCHTVNVYAQANGNSVIVRCCTLVLDEPAELLKFTDGNLNARSTNINIKPINW
jgi:hypothetical protein